MLEEKLLLTRLLVLLWTSCRFRLDQMSVQYPYNGGLLLEHPPQPQLARTLGSTNKVGDFPSIVVCYISLNLVTLVSLGSAGVPRSHLHGYRTSLIYND